MVDQKNYSTGGVQTRRGPRPLRAFSRIIRFILFAAEVDKGVYTFAVALRVVGHQHGTDLVLVNLL